MNITPGTYSRLRTAPGSGRNLERFSFRAFISLFRWDLPPKDPRRVYPLRIPDAVLAGSLYSIHIRTYLHYFNNGELRIPKSRRLTKQGSMDPGSKDPIGQSEL